LDDLFSAEKASARVGDKSKVPARLCAIGSNIRARFEEAGGAAEKLLRTRSSVRNGAITPKEIMRKRKILFIWVHNSARSQMAEAWLNYTCGVFFEAQSAGLEARTIIKQRPEPRPRARLRLTRACSPN
jgi:hypothetical protein